MGLGPINYCEAVARWEPNARARLERAALDLFAEQGYDATSVTQIADRAGLAKSGFFRYFTDKREVLFGGQDILVAFFTQGIAGSSPTASAIECVGSALQSAASVFTPERHVLMPQRRTIIAASTELQERELFKRARLVAAMKHALVDRGIDEVTARLAAEIGSVAFSMAFERWSEPANSAPFATLADRVLTELQDRLSALGPA